jgi:hypothetical protein
VVSAKTCNFAPELKKIRSMKAIVYQHLVRPSRFGRLVIPKRFEARKDVIEDAINDYIMNRANRQNWIPVHLFVVKIIDYKGRIKESWEYRPTYRK